MDHSSARRLRRLATLITLLALTLAAPLAAAPSGTPLTGDGHARVLDDLRTAGPLRPRLALRARTGDTRRRSWPATSTREEATSWGTLPGASAAARAVARHLDALELGAASRALDALAPTSAEARWLRWELALVRGDRRTRPAPALPDAIDPLRHPGSGYVRGLAAWAAGTPEAASDAFLEPPAGLAEVPALLHYWRARVATTARQGARAAAMLAAWPPSEAGTAAALRRAALAARSAMRRGDAAEAQRLVTEVLAMPARDSLATGLAALAGASAAIEARDVPAAGRLLRVAGAHLAPLGETWELAAVRGALGVVEELRGRLDAARAHHRAALALRRAHGDRLGAALAQSNVAVGLWQQGRYLAALATVDSARADAAPLAARTPWIAATRNRGVVLRSLGRHGEALIMADSALAAARVERNEREVVTALVERAYTAAADGRHALAAASLDSARAAGAAWLTPTSRAGVDLRLVQARVLAARGEAAAAADTVRAVLPVLEASGALADANTARVLLAEALAAAGAHEDAGRLARAATTAGARVIAEEDRWQGWRVLATVAAARGDEATARRWRRRADRAEHAARGLRSAVAPPRTRT